MISAGARRVGSQSVEPSMQESRFFFFETWDTCLISSGVRAETSHPDNPCKQLSTFESRAASPDLGLGLGLD